MSTGDATPPVGPPGVPTPPGRSAPRTPPQGTPSGEHRSDPGGAAGETSSRASVAGAAAAAASSFSSTSSRSEWPAHAADLVVDVVGTVRDKTTTPVLTIARAIVYGTAIVFLAVTALVLLLIALVRFVDAYLPGEVWSAYLLLGTLLTAGGLVLWATRRPAEEP